MRCTAIENLKHAVIKWPGRLYSGLFNYDIMHVLFLNCIGYLLDTLLGALTATVKQQLDTRVKSMWSFRNPIDGTTTPRVTALSSTAYLTAEMKVVHLFVWSHALGSKAQLLPASIRQDALVSISSLQTICYSVRGLRPFTMAEHHFIFGTLGRKFFKALSNISHVKRLEKIRKAEAYNIGKPPAKRRRVPHWRLAEKTSDESSDTASSTDSNCPPYYLRSDKIIPHAFVHFPEQVRMGGTHRFHDTCSAEACHIRCLGVAGKRARTYNDSNQSCDSMLNFMTSLHELQTICEHACIRDDEEVHVPSESDSSTSEPNDDAAEAANPIPQPDGKYNTVRLTCLLRADQHGGLGLSVLYRSRARRAIREDLHHDTWNSILCKGVPVSVREIVSLCVAALQLPNTAANRLSLLRCSWYLGWHVTATPPEGSSTHYWGGAGKTSNRNRQDWVEVAGTEICRGRATSRLARIICGVKIRNISKIFGREHLGDVWENVDSKSKDCVVLLLVRYACAHPDTTTRRGPNFRPLCPGLLKNTHCLWKWHQKPANYRRGCWQRRPWERHKHLFGATEAEQQSRKDKEKRAWYDVIQSSNIISHANVTKDWDRDDSFLQSVMWC